MEKVFLSPETVFLSQRSIFLNVCFWEFICLLNEFLLTESCVFVMYIQQASRRVSFFHMQNVTMLTTKSAPHADALCASPVKPNYISAYSHMIAMVLCTSTEAVVFSGVEVRLFPLLAVNKWISLAEVSSDPASPRTGKLHQVEGRPSRLAKFVNIDFRARAAAISCIWLTC
jgi:hypothetical protein